MSKRLLFLLITASILFTGVVLFLKSGLIYVDFSPTATYKLTPAEKKVFNDALAEFRRNPNMEFLNTKEFLDENEFGKPISSELFGVGFPSSAKGIRKGLVGIDYSLAYITKTDKTEIVEFFEWVISDSGELILVNYRGAPMKQTFLRGRDERKFLNEKYPNQWIIYLGEYFGRIEIRY